MASIGGQAVLEGVMMRGPSSWAVAVRRPDGRISEVAHDVESVAVHRRWLRLPIIRGVVALGESLAIGMRALSVSARYSVTDEDQDDASEELSRWAMVGAFVFAIGFSLVLFKVSPALVTNWINPGNTWVFLLLEGAIRVGILVAYLALIGCFGELRRVFQYHAAEHKAINAYEDGAALEPEVVQSYSLIHVRCGTAFLLWVMIIAILVFSVPGAAAAHVAADLAHRAAAADRRHRLRGHPPRGALPALRPRARRARARPLAAAPHDARADARSGRGLDPRARERAGRRGPVDRTGRKPRRGHGLR